MHIAICDDNIADRKQLERLLKRESDKRSSSTGILYADSFGSADSLLRNPMQYDIFYMDMCKTEGVSCREIVLQLIKMGVCKPIVMCCSDIDYRQDTYPDNVLFIQKPINQLDLQKSLDDALVIKSKAPSLIEIREENNTLYVTEPDILYATAKGRVVTVHLTDGRTASTRSSIPNLFSQWENYETILCPNTKTIINCRHLKKVGSLFITMNNHKRFYISHSCVGYAKMMQQKYRPSENL